MEAIEDKQGGLGNAVLSMVWSWSLLEMFTCMCSLVVADGLWVGAGACGHVYVILECLLSVLYLSAGSSMCFIKISSVDRCFRVLMVDFFVNFQMNVVMLSRVCPCAQHVSFLYWQYISS